MLALAAMALEKQRQQALQANCEALKQERSLLDYEVRCRSLFFHYVVVASLPTNAPAQLVTPTHHRRTKCPTCSVSVAVSEPSVASVS